VGKKLEVFLSQVDHLTISLGVITLKIINAYIDFLRSSNKSRNEKEIALPIEEAEVLQGKGGQFHGRRDLTRENRSALEDGLRK